MSRHGESLNNTHNIIGGNCHISERGEEYSQLLGDYFSSTQNLTVWTSELKRTKETASKINAKQTVVAWKNLNEIHSGNFDGFVLDDIKTNYPDLYLLRNNDKLTKSYPNGESYLDLYKRVSTVLDNIDTPQNGTLLIVAHHAVCRVIYSYFTHKPLSECTNIQINLHTLYELDEDKVTEINQISS